MYRLFTALSLSSLVLVGAGCLVNGGPTTSTMTTETFVLQLDQPAFVNNKNSIGHVQNFTGKDEDDTLAEEEFIMTLAWNETAPSLEEFIAIYTSVEQAEIGGEWLTHGKERVLPNETRRFETGYYRGGEHPVVLHILADTRSGIAAGVRQLAGLTWIK